MTEPAKAERDSRRLATQLATARILVGASELGKAAERVLEALCEGEGWVAGAVWRLEPDGGDHFTAVAVWRDRSLPLEEYEAATLRRRLRRGHGLPGRVAVSGRPWWVTDLREEAAFSRLPEAERAGLSCACVVPIPVGEQVAGVIEVFARERAEPDADTIEHLATVGAQLGLLVDRLERERERRSFEAVVEAERRETRSRVVAERRYVALGTLAAGVAHEVNNPLTYVRLNLGRLISLERARRPVDEMQEHRIGLLEEVREGVDRIASIVRELSAFSLSPGGRTRGVTDLEAVLRTALNMSRHELRHRARVIVEGDPLPPVRGEAEQIGQAVLHLLLNAVRGLPEGEAHLHEIRILRRAEGDRVALEIRDDGGGYAPEVLQSVFQPFYKAPGEAGPGLGLFVARQIAMEAGGDIELSSELGAGTTARLILLLADTRSEPARAPTPAALATRLSAEEARAPRRGRVLLVEDDLSVAVAMERLIAPHHEVTVAFSGREAIARLRQDRGFDAIVCDIMMAEGSGADVHDWLAAEAPALLERLLFVTGGATTVGARDLLARSSRPVLHKPFLDVALLSWLSEQVARGEPQRPGPRPPGEAGERESRAKSP